MARAVEGAVTGQVVAGEVTAGVLDGDGKAASEQVLLVAPDRFGPTEGLPVVGVGPPGRPSHDDGALREASASPAGAPKTARSHNIIQSVRTMKAVVAATLIVESGPGQEAMDDAWARHPCIREATRP